jgi:hypothetical protein
MLPSKGWKMSRYAIVVAAVLLGQLPGRPQVAVSTSAQSGQNSPAELPKIDVSYILAEFTQSLNARKLKLGEKIKAQVTQDVLSHGKVLIPADSRLLGHVAEIKESEKEDTESRLGIVFDKVLLKHHREIGLYGVMQALAPPALRRSKVDEPDQMLPPSLLIPQGGAVTPMGSRSSGGGVSSNSSMRYDTAPVTVAPPGPPSSTISRPAPDGTLAPAAGSPPISIGMPQGVFGIKGLILRPGSNSSSPVPVILSKTSNVKLEYGVQVLVKITETRRNP